MEQTITTSIIAFRALGVQLIMEPKNGLGGSPNL